MKEPNAVIDEVLRDPPLLHRMDDAGTLGVYKTTRDCYEFLASRVGPGTKTLETGAGVSTVLFMALGASHTCVGFETERDVILAYCKERNIATDNANFAVGRSEEVLPDLPKDELDLVLIDGNHGFPIAIADFLYAGGRLRSGGTLVLDDVHLPAVWLMADFCDLDPEWNRVAGTQQWGAWERRASGPIAADHYEQPFLSVAWTPGGGTFAQQARRLTQHGVRGARRRLTELRQRLVS